MISSSEDEEYISESSLNDEFSFSLKISFFIIFTLLFSFIFLFLFNLSGEGILLVFLGFNLGTKFSIVFRISNF